MRSYCYAVKEFFSYVITAVMIISSGFVTVSAEAKATPRLSVSEYETRLMTEQKDYTIKLSNARKSKVTWKVKKNKGISSPALKVVSKSKKRIVVEPLRNGDGTIECRVGKKRIICNYSVYLKQQTEEADKDLSDDELYQKVMNFLQISAFYYQCFGYVVASSLTIENYCCVSAYIRKGHLPVP